MPSVRLTVFPFASVVTNVLSRASLIRCASMSSAWSHVIFVHPVAFGARYRTESTRLAPTASCIADAPFGHRRPSFTGLSGSPSIWRSCPASFLYATSEQPAAQYGQTEGDSRPPAMCRRCFTSYACARSKPRAESPTPPAPAAPTLMKSRRLIADTARLPLVNVVRYEKPGPRLDVRRPGV